MPETRGYAHKEPKHAMAAGVTDLTDDTFESTIANATTPVLVDFWAEWCGPCRRVGPIVEELAGDYGDKLLVAKVDVDVNQGVASKHGIQSIPTLMIFKDGELKERLVGAHPKQTLKEAVDRFI
jgi:thioredoxin 1